jgi:hypothetical protein
VLLHEPSARAARAVGTSCTSRRNELRKVLLHFAVWNIFSAMLISTIPS